jgi:hypothetical protein
MTMLLQSILPSIGLSERVGFISGFHGYSQSATHYPMLTPDEVALCRDALLEAGVPLRVVDELTATRVRYTGKTRTLRAICALPTWFTLEGARSHRERSHLYQQIVQHLVDSGLAPVVEQLDQFGDRILSLDVTVVPPPGWSPK